MQNEQITLDCKQIHAIRQKLQILLLLALDASPEVAARVNKTVCELSALLGNNYKTTTVGIRDSRSEKDKCP